MSSQPDSKKNVIIPLIDRMRPYAPVLGSYDRSMLNLDFDYSVKLSNGRIDIAKKLLDDFEANPSYIPEERLKAAAGKFIPDSKIHVEPPLQTQPKEQPSYQPQAQSSVNPTIKPTVKKGRSIWFWIGVILILGLVISGFYNSQHRNEDFFLSNPSRAKSPEELRQELLLNESQNPITYLKVEDGKWRENLFGRTILEGNIANSATIANFKDIVIEVNWLTKTQTILKTEYYTIYEYVGAGKNKQFKIKVDGPSETGNVKMTISSATPIN